MVVGGGVAGMQAALDLADSGYFVYLLEKRGAIGGAMAQLDKTFPTNDCSMCILAPKLVECGRHLNIELMTLSEVLDVAGSEGDFTVTVKQHPRYVDMEKCIACGQCSAACPQAVDDEHNSGTTKRKAVSIQYAQAVPNKYQIDPGSCLWLKNPGQCGACANACPADAINFNDAETLHEIEVGSIIMAPGFQLFDPKKSEIWGYGKFPNVITSMELERYLSASGPTQGKLVRPSDGRTALKIAFLQCIGSRDNNCGNGYCSSVCCMYAIKEAMIAKEHVPELEASIYFMDMRAHGKDFDRYYEGARKTKGIKFIRSRIHGVERAGANENIRLHYINDQGHQVEDEYDLVILSVGLETPEPVIRLADTVGIHLTPERFASTSSFMPVLTSQKGIYSCGAFAGPRDVSRSVVGGSAAAAGAAQSLAASRHSLTRKINYPPEQDVCGQVPRVGVFVCHCGSNIAGVVDVAAVADYAATLPSVTHVERNLFSCSQDTQELMIESIRNNGLNRIVVASCTPRTHEQLFRETLKAAGINEYLFEMANIRNQNAWVHTGEPEQATQKAKDLIRMAVAKVSSQVPLRKLTVPITPSALVMGGGLTGMASAISLAEQGFKVDLVEKTGHLGGNAIHLYRTWTGEHVPPFLAKLEQRINEHNNITLHRKTTVLSLSGYVGNFTTVVKTDKGRKKSIKHGAGIVAVGGKRLLPDEYGYGVFPGVLASVEFDKLHIHNGVQVSKAQTFVFIQCVGSRDSNRPYCSKVCCTHSVQSSIKLKTEDPSRQVYILYREMRTYGQRERLYKQARELGVVFINYELHGKPKVDRDKDGLQVEVWDHVLHRPFSIRADMVILASAILPNPDGGQLSQLFKIPLDADGFFQEAHAKLRPLDCATEGMFVAGMAHAPKPIEESIAQALGAASRAATLLSRQEISLDAVKADVIAEHCDGCGLCIDVCPYSALSLVEETDKKGNAHTLAVLNKALCKGCGICQGTCPKRGITVAGFTYEQLSAQVEAALVDQGEGA